MNLNAAYFGGYRTKSFAEIFPDVKSFTDLYNKALFPKMLYTTPEYTNFGINTIYAILAARFFESHIACDSEDAFKLQIMSKIFQYGQTWQRQMKIQQDLLAMEKNDLLDGGKIINNHAKNPGTAPSTAALTELQYIDEQSTVNYKKYALDVWPQLQALFKTDLIKNFTDKFRDLFIRVTYPDYPLYYYEQGDITNG